MVKFSLLENAIDSIETGLAHFYLAEKEHSDHDYKRCLLDLFQGAELVLKTTLARINDTLIFEESSLKKFCNEPQQPTVQELYRCKSVTIYELCKRVKKYYPALFDEEDLKLMNALATERNKIQHFAIEINPEHLAVLLRELYLKVFKPAFRVILIDEEGIDSFNSKIKQQIISFEEQFLNITIEHEYTLALCPNCESWSHFIIYAGDSFPVETYCMCCNFHLCDLEIWDYKICPECDAASVIYVPEHQAGVCLWHKCYYSKEGGFLPMEPCKCGGYKIEERCEECDPE